jgi:hypothetical protein
VGGRLGLDFLYRWVPVIDFDRAALWLVPINVGAQETPAAQGA